MTATSTEPAAAPSSVSRWATFIVRARWWILGTASVLLIVTGVIGVAGMDSLSLSRFVVAGSESARANAALAERAHAGQPNVAIMLIPEDGTVDEPQAIAAGERLTATLAAYPRVASAWSYWTEDASSMRADDASSAWIFAYIPGDANEVRRDILPDLAVDFTVEHGPVRTIVAGADEVFRQVSELSREDFLLAEAIVIPLVLALLWLIYRRFRIAILTLGIGFLAVFGSLAVLGILAGLLDVSTFASNISLVLGIGLGVDYGLFMTFRFREELNRTPSTTEALSRTMQGAGRTVFFSGLTVAASLATLLVFPYPFLASFAYGGISVVAIATAAALVVLPAGLAVLGPRVQRRKAHERPIESGAWYRIPAAVVRRPGLVGGIGFAVVFAFAAPAMGISFGLPDDRVLPSSAAVREAYDIERDQFTAADSDALLVVAEEIGAAGWIDEGEIGEYAAALSNVDGIVRVDTAIGSYVDGRATQAPPSERFDAAQMTWLSATPSTEVLEHDVHGLVTDIRELPSPAPMLVGGYLAELVDYRDGVTSYLPLVGLLIILVTAVILFLMTGSVVMPLLATLLNVLSTAVMFAVLVWGFQNGGLAGLLAFTPAGTIEPSIPILMFCIAYALSMDYSVFLIASIKEELDRTGDAVHAIPLGIARSGPLVTAAAVTLAASFLVYATGQVVFLQQLGIGMAAAVLIDATLIRGVLLPAGLRLAGRWAWWAPKSLRALHLRVDFAEHPAVSSAGIERGS